MDGSDPLDEQLAGGRMAADDVEGRRIREHLRGRLFHRSAPVKIGRYEVIRKLGAGGSGVVYAAHDPRLERRVAVKLVRPDRLESEGTKPGERSLQEARLLAELSHPNVVSVFDVGVEGDEVFIAMELVSGQDLQKWARKPRTWPEMRDVLAAAGRGLAAAHAAGIVHRDFKPNNVLVADDGEVKVVDFGLADRAAQDAEVVRAGTLGFMAPELLAGEPASVASDVYAFCVSVRELLTGQRPADLGRSSGRVGAPMRLRGSDDSIPRRLMRAVAAGLQRDPSARPTMDALLEALAHDPTRRRDRWLRGLGTLSVMGLVVVSYRVWADVRAQRCSGAEQQLAGVWDEARRTEVSNAIVGTGKSYAPAVWARTERELDAYAQDWKAMHVEACVATAVRGEQSSQILDLRMACLRRAAQQLQATVETLADATDDVVRNAHELTAALQPLSRCADSEALAAEVEPPMQEEAEAVNAVRLQLARAEALVQAGRYRAAQQAVQGAKDGLATVEYEPVRTEIALQEGIVLARLGRYDQSEAALREALALGSRWRQREAMASAASRLMFVVGSDQGRTQEGLRYLALTEGLSRGQPAREAVVRSNLGSILQSQGEYARAEAEFRAALSLRQKALGPDHLHVAASRNNLAAVLEAQGHYPESESQVRAALSLWEKTLGSGHPNVSMARQNLANILSTQGKYAQAETEIRAVLSARMETMGPQHPDVAGSRGNLAAVLYQQGEYAEAETELRAALSMLLEVLGPNHPHVAGLRGNLALILVEQGRLEEAEVQHRVVVSVLQRSLGTDHPQVALAHDNLALVLSAQGHYAKAETEHRAALRIRDKALDSDHPDVARSRSNLALVLLELDRSAEALTLAEQAWTRRKRDDIGADSRAETAFVLARILWRVADARSERRTDGGLRRDRSRALRLADDALRAYGEAGDAYAEQILEVREWIDSRPRR